MPDFWTIVRSLAPCQVKLLYGLLELAEYKAMVFPVTDAGASEEAGSAIVVTVLEEVAACLQLARIAPNPNKTSIIFVFIVK